MAQIYVVALSLLESITIKTTFRKNELRCGGLGRKFSALEDFKSPSTVSQPAEF